MDTETKHHKKKQPLFSVRSGLIPWPNQWQKKETALKVQLKTFLEQVVESSVWHSRWLNTLAFMEYIGCRKIIKSQHSADLNLMLLQHISEEARHAFHFKKLAYKVSPTPDFQESHMLKGAEAEDYFQSIDHKVEADLNPSTLPVMGPKKHSQKRLNYLYTTWLIEERALMVYNIYNQILKLGDCSTRTFPFNLDFILREEDGHLKTTINFIREQDPDFRARSHRLWDFEQKQFALLLTEWQKTTLDKR